MPPLPPPLDNNMANMAGNNMANMAGNNMGILGSGPTFFGGPMGYGPMMGTGPTPEMMNQMNQMMMFGGVSALPLLYIIQDSHRLDKYLNLGGFLEKSLKIKSALKSTGKSLKGFGSAVAQW